MKPILWLRAETKDGEERRALSPENAGKLVDAGFSVTVEKSEQSVFSHESYLALGCHGAKEGEWVSAPDKTFILGLKELPGGNIPLKHQHIYFAHVFKNQSGWQNILKQFKSGGGALFDLEYLTDAENRRVVAFGYWAGFAGACLAVKTWCAQQNDRVSQMILSSYKSKDKLTRHLQDELSPFKKPRAMVIGAKGRSGQGAVDACKACGLEVIEWDFDETRRGGPFVEILDNEIFINCVFVNSNIPPFIDEDLLNIPRRSLSVICDVSCDPTGDFNSLPIYTESTTFKAPTLSLKKEKPALDLIAIDNLPSLLPKESSEDFSNQLLPYLMGLGELDKGVWPGALKLFNHFTEKIYD